MRVTLQLDFSYATILFFGQLRNLYRETNMKYMITTKERPNNHPIYVVHTNLESFIFFNDSGMNDVDSQILEVEDVSEIFDYIRKILEKEKENFPSALE